MYFRDDPLPVVVYIHGGAFVKGEGATYIGSEVSIVGRVVIVNFNYRLNTLGFMATQTEAAPGNFGLWDQIAALQWIQQNIAQFGGDPDRVTIMGLSAGGASVSHLALSPEAKGLFHRCIAMSGSAASYFGFTRLQPLTTTNLALTYNCPVDNDEAAVDCLRNESAYYLSMVGLAVPVFQQQMFFNQVPVIDGDLVPAYPLDSMYAGLNTDYDMLIGRTKDDGADYGIPFARTKELLRTYAEFVCNVYENRDELVAMIYEQYPGFASDDLETREKAVTAAATDFVFGCRSFLEAGIHSKYVA